jgi:hypothetical protein
MKDAGRKPKIDAFFFEALFNREIEILHHLGVRSRSPNICDGGVAR